MTAIESTVLRPLRLGEILDRAIRIYRRQFLQLLAIIALVQIPITILQLIGSLLIGDSLANFPLFDPTAPGNPFIFGDIFGPPQILGSSLNTLSSILSFFLVNGIATVVLTRIVGLSYLGEVTPGIIESYRRSKGDYMQIIVALIVYLMVTIFLLLWWLLIPCLGWLTGGGMLIFMSAVILPLLAPAVVLEGQPAANAWRRAWELGRRRFWWLTGFSLILSIFAFLVVGAPAAIIAAISQFSLTDPLAPLNNTVFAIQVIAQSLITLFGVILLVPLRVACFTVAYYDLRVRHEGLDLTLQVLQKDESKMAGEVTSQTGEAPIYSQTGRLPGESVGWIEKLRTTAPAIAREQLITWEEMGRFAIITVGLIMLVMALYGVLLAIVFTLIGPSLSQF